MKLTLLSALLSLFFAAAVAGFLSSLAATKPYMTRQAIAGRANRSGMSNRNFVLPSLYSPPLPK